MSRTLLWHRNDLRLQDNQALSKAVEAGTVIPLFVVDPAFGPYVGDRRATFLCDCITSLRDQYRALGSDLLIREGQPEGVVPTVAEEVGADSVVVSASYSPFGRRRDERVEMSLSKPLTRVDDRLAHPPGSITTASGTAYKVFSYFHDAWAERPVPSPATEPSASAVAKAESLPKENESVPTPATFDASPTASPFDGSTKAANDRLKAFLSGPIESYDSTADRADLATTSKLSPHLSLGTIGIRHVLDATPADGEGPLAFRRQLAFRSFYTHLLADNPELPFENGVDFDRAFEWRNTQDEFEAWRTGQTGFPLVDAGMTQLAEEGFIHNRVRMLVASFLCKILQIDWRWGYRHFREHLVDHDTANDCCGWQWAASTGHHAQAYYRMLHPVRQAETHDPDATYIKRWLPAFESVDPSLAIAYPERDPVERDSVASYPDPIVDFDARRENTQTRFERAYGKE